VDVMPAVARKRKLYLCLQGVVVGICLCIQTCFLSLKSHCNKHLETLQQESQSY
jgi:hypothetical protein